MMSFKCKGTRRILLALVLFLALPSSLLARPTPAVDGEAAARAVRNLLERVQNEFIEEVPTPLLVNGALDGIRLLLEEKGLDSSFLGQVSPEAPRAVALAYLTRQFHAAASRYPELMEGNLLTYKAIHGMLDILDDPYTDFLTPEDYARLREYMKGGDFGGLGIYIEMRKENREDPDETGLLTIVEPIPDTPAERAGLQPDDVIVRIDGVSTRGITIEEAKSRLRGKPGTEVVLAIRRNGQVFEVALVREKIHVNSVSHRIIESHGRRLGYLKLRMFGEKTNEELEAALRALENQGAEGYILDVRNNGGGYIAAAVDVCSKFLRTGSRVVSVAERGAPLSVYNSRPNPRPERPLVVLVNESSASASEITAAAMKDHDRAVLVGTKTFGKGSVQKIFEMRDRSALKITTAHYLTPSGADIDKRGVEPDIKVEMERRRVGTPDDVQLAKAVEVLLAELAKGDDTAEPPPYPGAVRISSVDQELAYLGSLTCEDGGRFEVVHRRPFRKDGFLLEEVRVRCNRGGEERVLLFDLSGYLGR